MTPEEKAQRAKALRAKQLRARAASGDVDLEALANRPAGGSEMTHTAGHSASSQESREDRIRMGLDHYRHSPGAVIGHGLREGGSLGFADELGGLGQAGLQTGPYLFPDTAKTLAERFPFIGNPGTRDANGAPLSPLQVYRDARNGNRLEEKDIRTDRPGLYGASELAGSLAIPVPGANGVLGATKATALLGGLNALGHSNADITTGEMAPLRMAGADMAFGAAGGGFGGLLGSLMASKTPMLMRALRTKTENAAIDQGRRTLLNGADSLANKFPVSDDAVREALASGAIMPFGTTKGAAGRLEDLTQNQAKTYAETLSELERLGVPGPEARELAGKLHARAAQELATSGANEAVPDAFRSEAEAILERARGNSAGRTYSTADLASGAPARQPLRLKLGQAEAIKRKLQDQARYGVFNETPLNEARQEIASTVRQANEDVIDAAGQAAPEFSDIRNLADGFVPVKRRLGNLIEARNAAERGATRAANRSSGGMAGQVGMGTALATGNLPAAATSSIGAALLRSAANRGASTFAAGSYAASRGFKALANAAARNPALTRSLGAMLGSGFARDAVVDAQRASDPDSGLTPEEMNTLASLLQRMRGQ